MDSQLLYNSVKVFTAGEFKWWCVYCGVGGGRVLSTTFDRLSSDNERY